MTIEELEAQVKELQGQLTDAQETMKTTAEGSEGYKEKIEDIKARIDDLADRLPPKNDGGDAGGEGGEGGEGGDAEDGLTDEEILWRKFDDLETRLEKMNELHSKDKLEWARKDLKRDFPDVPEEELKGETVEELKVSAESYIKRFEAMKEKARGEVKEELEEKFDLVLHSSGGEEVTSVEDLQKQYDEAEKRGDTVTMFKLEPQLQRMKRKEAPV